MAILALTEGAISVSNLSELSTIDIDFFTDGSIASVVSLLDTFYLDKGTGIASDGINVIDAFSNTSNPGKWIRTLSHNLKWSKQQNWYISNYGNDENSGKTQSQPLKTIKEWYQRIGQNQIDIIMTLYILDDVVNSSSDMFYANLNITQNGKVIITGEESTIAPSYIGNLYTETTSTDPSTNQPFIISLTGDGSISNDFWSYHISNLGSNLCERLVVLGGPNDGYSSWAAKDYGNKICATSQPILSDISSLHHHSMGNFSDGDLISIQVLPKIGGTFSVHIASPEDNDPKFIIKQIATNSYCNLIINTNNSPARSCCFYDSDLSYSDCFGSRSYINCRFNQINTRPGDGLIEMYGGLCSSEVNLTSDNVLIDYRFMIQGASLNKLSPSSSCQIGSIQIYDSPTSGINFKLNSSASFENLNGDREIFGKDNALCGIRVYSGAMPKYKLNINGFTLTGNISDLIIGTSDIDTTTHYQYNDLPIIDADKLKISGITYINSISGFVISD